MTTRRQAPASGWFPVAHADVDLLDDVVLVAWVRLYAQADAVWPANAAIPRWATDDVLGRLGSRLWLDSGGAYYRIPELDERRQAASTSASNAANVRWAAARQGRFDLGEDAGRNAARNAPSNAEPHAETYAEMMPTQNQNQNQNQLSKQASKPRASDAEGNAAGIGPYRAEGGRIVRG